RTFHLRQRRRGIEGEQLDEPRTCKHRYLLIDRAVGQTDGGALFRCVASGYLLDQSAHFLLRPFSAAQKDEKFVSELLFFRRCDLLDSRGAHDILALTAKQL